MTVAATEIKSCCAAAYSSAAARFLIGDAEALPLEDKCMDGALCECALCTFPDKEAAAAELARVLRKGGRLLLADIVAEPERLPDELRSLTAWVACVADARSVDELSALLERAGFAIESVERHDDALARLLDAVDGRLRAEALAWPGLLDDGLDQGRELVRAARAALGEGDLGYASLLARRA